MEGIHIIYHRCCYAKSSCSWKLKRKWKRDKAFRASGYWGWLRAYWDIKTAIKDRFTWTSWKFQTSKILHFKVAWQSCASGTYLKSYILSKIRYDINNGKYAKRIETVFHRLQDKVQTRTTVQKRSFYLILCIWWWERSLWLCG